MSSTSTSPRVAAAPTNWISWAGVLPPSVGAGMLALQNAALNVSIPFAAREFGVGIADVSLIVLVYLLTIGATLITAGRLGDVLGSRRVFAFGVSLYLVGSILCGFAPNLVLLLGLRVIQAVGASAVISNEIALATRSASPSRRGQAIASTWMLANLGALLGPVVGGLLADTLDWRFVFWVNVPIALGLLLVGIRGVPPDTGPARRPDVDVAGAVLFGATMVSLLAALNRGPTWGFGAPFTLGLFGAALIAGWALVWHEARTDAPMLDLSLFRIRAFSAAMGSALANHLANQGLVFLVPFYLVEQQGLSATQAGAVLVPMAVTTVVVAFAAGWLADRTGPRPLETVGLFCLATTLLWLALDRSPSTLEISARLVLAGFGTTLFSVSNANAVIEAVPKTQIGLVGGLIHANRYVGLIGGVALAGAIYTVASGGAAAGTSAAGFTATYTVLAAIAALGALLCLVRGRAHPE